MSGSGRRGFRGDGWISLGETWVGFNPFFPSLSLLLALPEKLHSWSLADPRKPLGSQGAYPEVSQKYFYLLLPGLLVTLPLQHAVHTPLAWLHGIAWQGYDWAVSFLSELY